MRNTCLTSSMTNENTFEHNSFTSSKLQSFFSGNVSLRFRFLLDTPRSKWKTTGSACTKNQVSRNSLYLYLDSIQRLLFLISAALRFVFNKPPYSNKHLHFESGIQKILTLNSTLSHLNEILYCKLKKAKGKSSFVMFVCLYISNHSCLDPRLSAINVHWLTHYVIRY